MNLTSAFGLAMLLLVGKFEAPLVFFASSQSEISIPKNHTNDAIAITK